MIFMRFRGPQALNDTYEKRGEGMSVIVNQESEKDSCPERAQRDGRRGPLPEFFVGSFFGRGFASGLAFGAGEGVFEHFSDAAVAGFGCAAIEDAEQPVAALDRSHGLPALIGAGIAGEGEF